MPDASIRKKIKECALFVPVDRPRRLSMTYLLPPFLSTTEQRGSDR
jgi:hypothetical protein